MIFFVPSPLGIGWRKDTMPSTAQPGIVDQHVGMTGLLVQTLPVGCAPQIGGQDAGAAARRADLTGQGLQPFAAARFACQRDRSIPAMQNEQGQPDVYFSGQ